MKLKLLALCVLSSSLLIGCGDDDSTTATTNGTGGSQQTDTVFYGQVIRNDGQTVTVRNGDTVKTYDISNTGTTVNTDSSSGNGLAAVQPGMMVTINAADSMATMITYDTEVEGIVESITGTELMVMGQTIVTDDMTMYGGTYTALADISVDDDVEINGEMMDNGSILAKFIEPHTDGGYEIEGIVTAVTGDPVSMFTVGNCDVSIVDATTFDSDTTLTDIVEGAEIEVSILMMDQIVPDCTLGPVDADVIELENPAPVAPAPADPNAGTTPVGGNTGGTSPIAEVISVEGMVVADPVAGAFDVIDVVGATTPVMVVDGTTIYIDGMLADVVMNTPVVVTGTMNVEGVLEATEVVIMIMKMPQMDMTEFEGVATTAATMVAGTDPAVYSFEAGYMMDGSAMTATVMISELTMLDGGGVMDLMVDTMVVVKGYPDAADMTIIHAEIVEMTQPPVMHPVMLKGMIESIDAEGMQITVLGLDVSVVMDMVDGNTLIYGMPPAPAMGAAAVVVDPNAPLIVFADLMMGDYVAIDSYMVEGNITATTIVVMEAPMDPAMPMDKVSGLAMIMMTETPGMYDIEVAGIKVLTTVDTVLPAGPDAATLFDLMMLNETHVDVTGMFDMDSGDFTATSIMPAVMPAVM